jgi:hypothetical protein
MNNFYEYLGVLLSGFVLLSCIRLEPILWVV